MSLVRVVERQDYARLTDGLGILDSDECHYISGGVLYEEVGLMPILHKKVAAIWCHEHEQWECWWIEGIGQEVGAVWPLVGCHKKASQKKPWCKEHKP